MKNNLICLFIFCISIATIHAQPGCPSINAGPDVTLNCGQSSANLNATVIATGTTTTYNVIAVPYAPPYPYNTGTPILVNIDDTWGSAINLPFNFCYYNNNYSQIVPGSNGVITFDATNSGGYCPWSYTSTCPSANLPLNSVFGPYEDIDPSVSGNMYSSILGTYPCRTYVVNWNQVAMFSSTCNSLKATSQIVLYESTNIIEVYILNKPLCSSWNSGNGLIGIQNATGTVGLTPPGRNTGQWTAANEAWRFTPNGPPNYVVNWYQGINSIGTGTSVTVSPTTTTTYTAEAVYTNCNGNAVTVTDNVVVTPNLNFNLSVTPTHPVICDAGSVTLAASGSSTSYTWSPSTGLSSTTDSIVVATPTVSTVYVVTGTDGICTGTDTVFVTVSPHPVITATGSIICIGDTGTVTASSTVPGTTYLWTPTADTANPIFVSPTATTTYSVVGNAAGCLDSATATVTVNPLPLINVNDITICSGFSGQLNATNGISYIWEDSTTLNPRTVTPIQTTTYYVVGTDANGCSNLDSATVTVNNSPIVNVDPAAICKGFTTSLTATGADTYVWNNGSTSNPLVISPSSTAIYSVTGSVNGCLGTDTALVTVYPSPLASFEPNPSITTTDEPNINFLNSSTGGYLWYWNFGDINSTDNTSLEMNPSHTYSSYGHFPIWLIVESDKGCVDSTERFVTVENPFTFYIPNAFSPNGLGTNEIFIPTGVGIDLSFYEMVIYDRWGELVFKTNDLYEGWNGKKNNVGDTFPSGVYVYHIKLRQIEGIKHLYSGQVTLIR